MIRLHVSDPLSAGAPVRPTLDQVRYLLGVMRLQTGSKLLLFNGKDGEWESVVDVVGKRDCVLHPKTQARSQISTPDVELIVALVKRGPLETIVEKATELGVRKIHLVTTQRTNADHTRVDRLQAIATEAAEQTGRLDVPEVIEPVRLEVLLHDWNRTRQLMFCDEAGDDPKADWGGAQGRARPVLEAVASFESEACWAVLIGPEGGFAPEERRDIRDQPFVIPVTLGPRILRADTAAIAALALWQAARGDWV